GSRSCRVIRWKSSSHNGTSVLGLSLAPYRFASFSLAPTQCFGRGCRFSASSKAKGFKSKKRNQYNADPCKQITEQSVECRMLPELRRCKWQLDELISGLIHIW